MEPGFDIWRYLDMSWHFGTGGLSERGIHYRNPDDTRAPNVADYLIFIFQTDLTLGFQYVFKNRFGIGVGYNVYTSIFWPGDLLIHHGLVIQAGFSFGF
jgi:hypothetical protein